MNAMLDEMLAAGLRVNWRTLLVGLDGPSGHPPVLSLKDIGTCAEERSGCASQVEAAVEVLLALDGGEEEVRGVLRGLAVREPGDVVSEVRKWRVVLLLRVLSCLPLDPVYGLLALTDFWALFGFPEDGPHRVQGRGDSSTPEDYYTAENLSRTLHDHVTWVDAETKALRRLA